MRREVESLLAEDAARQGMNQRDVLSNHAKRWGSCTSGAACEGREPVEDPLGYLPYAALTEHAKGQLIYGGALPSESIDLV